MKTLEIASKYTNTLNLISIMRLGGILKYLIMDFYIMLNKYVWHFSIIKPKKSSKSYFAERIVPTFPDDEFANFRELFERILQLIQIGSDIQEESFF